MLNLVYCELMKLKRSRMLAFAVVGTWATPVMLFIEGVQQHFEQPERVVTLEHFYSNSLLYVMLIMNMMIYIAIEAHLFSREYTERTLKNILPLPISRVKLLLGKYFTLFLIIICLMGITWLEVLTIAGIYQLLFYVEAFKLSIALAWLLKFIVAGIVMFLTLSPFAYIAEKTKGLVIPMIAAAVIIMGSAALCNQDLGALYPFTAGYLLIQDKILDTGYSISVSIGIMLVVSIVGYILTMTYFEKEDLR